MSYMILGNEIEKKDIPLKLPEIIKMGRPY